MAVVNRVLNALPSTLVRAAVHRLWPLQEPELSRLDDYLPQGRTAVDVGAWWGPWSAALAKRCPEVHSFEPQPHLAARLRDWAPDHVHVHQAGVGAEPGTATLTRPDALPGTDGLATLRPDAAHVDGSTESLEVDVVTIDSCSISNVGFIKVDVEGLELAALFGAIQTIEADHPRLMIEIEQRHLDVPIADVFHWLGQRGYRGWFLRGTARSSTWHRLDEFDVQADQLDHVNRPKSAEYINAFLFTHSEDGWEPPA